MTDDHGTRPEMPWVPPAVTFLVCATARSGSSLLCDYLSSLGVAGRPDEYFSRKAPGGALEPPTWLAERTSLSPREYLRLLVDLGSTPNGVFGAKVTTTTLQDLLELLRASFGCSKSDQELLSEAFPCLHFVVVTRRDKIRQAISIARVLKTREFAVRDVTNRTLDTEPFYSFPLVELSVNDIVAGERDLERIFAEWKFEPYTVVYEDLVARPRETITGLLKFGGLADDVPVVTPTSHLVRLSDATSDDWASRHDRRRVWMHRVLLAAALPAIFRNRNLTKYYVGRFFRRITRARE